MDRIIIIAMLGPLVITLLAWMVIFVMRRRRQPVAWVIPNCRQCGQPTMHMGSLCYRCGQVCLDEGEV